jgi:hypothetical protein
LLHRQIVRKGCVQFAGIEDLGHLRLQSLKAMPLGVASETVIDPLLPILKGCLHFFCNRSIFPYSERIGKSPANLPGIPPGEYRNSLCHGGYPGTSRASSPGLWGNRGYCGSWSRRCSRASPPGPLRSTSSLCNKSLHLCGTLSAPLSFCMTSSFPNILL